MISYIELEHPWKWQIGDEVWDDNSAAYPSGWQPIAGAFCGMTASEGRRGRRPASSQLTTTQLDSLACAASVEQLRDLAVHILTVLNAGEETMKLLREMCAGEATGFAGALLSRFNYGLAHFRECDAMLGQAWRAKNTADRAQHDAREAL